MPTTISVSPAVPDKLVVNGVDLVNREELSDSQQRELQRYIDANAHLLGFLDKEREEREAAEQKAARAGGTLSVLIPPLGGSGASGGGATAASPGSAPVRHHQQYSSYSLGREPAGSVGGGGGGEGIRSPLDDTSSLYARPPSATQSLNYARLGMGSPSSDYGGPGGKRKGVSWSDVDPSPMPGQGRSQSPSQLGYPQQQHAMGNGYGDPLAAYNDRSRAGDYERNGPKMARERSPPYSTIDKQRTPFDQDSAYWTSPSPWAGSWDRATGRDGSKEREKSAGWQGFAKPDLPTYSALERNPDDFNPFQTHLHREESIGLRKSQEDKDEAIKFYGYGDHRVSGLEMKHKRWQGGEVVTDPNIMKKSLKPRRLFYSPIGDGVVEADGIEMKYPPKDMTPRKYVYHQRYVEQDPGKPGLKVTEEIWHEGGDGPGDAGAGGGQFPALPDDGLGADRGRGPIGPADDGRGRGDAGPPLGPPADDGARKGPGDGDWPRLAKDDGLGKFPPLDDGLGRGPWPAADDGGRPRADDDGLGARPASAAPSTGSGAPREGWQITFIANPRECINIYGSETLTNIFDLEDHTPKTVTTIKETYSPAPPDLLPPVREEEQPSLVTIGGK